MAYLLSELGQYLQDQSVATLGTNLFRGKLPDTPDSCLALFEYAGREPLRAFRGSPGQAVAERPRLQVVSRSKTYDAAMSGAQVVFGKLDGLGDTTMSGVNYLWIEALQSPFLMTRDENERVLIACNYEVVKRLT